MMGLFFSQIPYAFSQRRNFTSLQGSGYIWQGKKELSSVFLFLTITHIKTVTDVSRSDVGGVVCV
jgi:hypothetical protein